MPVFMPVSESASTSTLARGWIRRRALVPLAIVVAVTVAATDLPAAADTSPDTSTAGRRRGRYDRTLNLTLPVAGRVSFTNDYHADRSGGARKHQATDLIADKLQRIHAAKAGVISWMTGIDGPMPSWGYGMSIRGNDGFDYVYLHINNDRPGTDDGRGGLRWAYAPHLRPGMRVARGQFLGYVGDSGASETTAPHLHFEIHDPDQRDRRVSRPPYRDPTRINPYFSLRAAVARRDLPGRRYPRPDPVVHRGGNSQRTAVALSKSRTRTASTVIIVPAGSPHRAFASAGLAGASNGVVLPAGRDGFGAATLDEIRRLRPSKAYLVGDHRQLPRRIVRRLRRMGVGNVERIAGKNRYEASAALGRAITARTGSRLRVAYLVQGAGTARSWRHALAVSGLAARERAAVLYAYRGGLPDATVSALRRLRPHRILAVGRAVPRSAAASAKRVSGAQVIRLPGRNAARISARAATRSRKAGLRSSTVHVAALHNWRQTHAAGAAAAAAGSPLLLVNGRGGRPGTPAKRWLRGYSPLLDRAVAVGNAVKRPTRRAVGRHLAGR